MDEKNKAEFRKWIGQFPTEQELDSHIAVVRVMYNALRSQLVAKVGEPMVEAFEQACKHLNEDVMFKDLLDSARKRGQELDDEDGTAV